MKELEDAYRQANNEIDPAFDITTADGLEEDQSSTWILSEKNKGYHMKKLSWLQKINYTTRSILFTIAMAMITIPFSFLCIAAHMTLPLKYRCAMIAWWTSTMLWLLKFFCNIHYQVQGLENIPKDRNGIIFSKHQSTWETFYLQSIFPETAIILKRELVWIPFFGWGLAITNPIAINRSNKSSAMSQILQKGKKYLEDGRWILFFPEGTRIAPGKVGTYRAGGVRLAVQTGHPIIPVAHNAGRYWPKSLWIKRPGTIQVVIGSAIETQDRKPEEVLEEAKAWIETTIEKIDAS